jgi:metallophosphoesterase (TIGR03767 family)
MDRRAFLARAGGAAAALWLPPAIGRPGRLTVRSVPLRRSGLPAASPEGTTLEATVIRADGDGYLRLLDGPGWATQVRTDLAEPQSGREDRRRPLAAVVHLTDIHLIDAQSTGRVEFLDPYGEPFTAAYRAHETLTLHVANSMVTRVNALPGGPITGRPFDCAVSTGDNIDNYQTNEASWFFGVMDGGRQQANSGAPDRYEGVQERGGAAAAIDSTYWHPDEGIDDEWKARGFPTVPGLLDAAIAPFDGPGLSIPWYSTYGNHDGLVQGNVPVTPALEEVLGARWKLVELPAGAGPVAFIGTVALAEPGSIEAKFESGEYPAREVTPDAGRGTISPRDWVQLHLDSPDTPGPAGHGYTEDHLELPALFYEFEVAPGVVGLSLDTGGYYSGSLGEDQVAWLKERLAAHSSRHFDEAGTEVTTGNDDRLMIAFSHFNPRSMDSAITNPDRPDEKRIFGDEVVALFHRYPNFVAWINGHHHVNQIEPMTDPSGRGGGFWDINTASHVDYPQHARLIEVVDNDDGTLSIFSTMIEHAAPAATDYGDTSMLGLAAISRELSANDPQSELAVRLGAEKDLNVELVIAAPFDLKAAGIGEPVSTSVPSSAAPSGEAAEGGSQDGDDENEWATVAVGGLVGVATVGVVGALALRRRGQATTEVADRDADSPD